MEYIFTALIPIIAVTSIILLSKRIASHSLQCKHCSHSFRIKWQQVIVTAHSGKEYMLVCPRCKIKDWCALQPLSDK